MSPDELWGSDRGQEEEGREQGQPVGAVLGALGTAALAPL